MEIVLIDGGDNIGATTDMPDAPASMPAGPRPNPVSPAPRWKGEPSDSSSEPQEVKGPTAAESAGTLISTIGKLLGGSPLINAAQQLARAFTDINKSIQNIADRSTMPSATVSPAAGPSRAPAPGAPAASPQAPQVNPVSGRPITNVNIQPVSKSPKGGAMPVAGRPPTATPGPAAAPVTGPAASSATSAASGMASLAKFAGPAAIAVAGLTAAVAAGAMVMKGVFDVLGGQVKKLENVSADVSVAASMTEVRRELADLRRADSIGPDLARFENMRSKVEDKLSDLGTQGIKILLRLVELFEPMVPHVINGINVLIAAGDLGIATIDKVVAALTVMNQNDDAAAAGAQLAALNRMRVALDALLAGQQQQQEDENDPFLAAFLAQFAGGGQL